ncbi:MAG: hypothetical protein IT452_06140 [Planctomycetia bacterium]|nr:hypothetical protein [Planctomycetia bacterium]
MRLTPEEQFLAARIADPMMRSRDIIEAISLAVAGEARGAAGAVAGVAADRKRPPALRRIAAAAYWRLAGEAGGARFDADWRAAAGDERGILGLALGRAEAVAAGLDAAATDEDASGWLGVAHTLALREALPALERALRNPARHPDVRRQAAEVFRALTAADPAARRALLATSPRDGSALDDLLSLAAGE